MHLADNNKNEIYYNESNWPENQKASFKILDNAPNDITPPEISSLTLDKTSVEPLDKIVVTATITDDISGVDTAYARFINTENNRDYFISLENSHFDSDTGEYVPYEENKYVGNIEISEHEPTGVFYLKEVVLEDKSRNEVFLGEKHDILLPFTASFTVTNNGTSDSTPPILTNIVLDKSNIEAPSIIKVNATITDDFSGVDSAYIWFRNAKNNRNFFVPLTSDDNNLNHYLGEINVSQYEPTGLFELSKIQLTDKSGNNIEFDNSYDSHPLFDKISFFIKNVDDVGDIDLITNTNNPNLANDIEKLPNDATIAINYGTGSTLPADVFDAIKGTNKKIILESNGIQWEFNGEDIGDTTKRIDLNVTIDEINNSTSTNTEEISNIVADTPTVVLSFPNNGVLPGKAKIRVKIDYALENYIGKNGLYVYYFDSTEKKLIPISTNIVVAQDGYLEFEITHNSDFIITKGEIKTLKPDVIPNSPIINSNTSSSGSGSGGGGKDANANLVKTATVIKNTIAAVNNAIVAARKAGQSATTVDITVKNTTEVSPATIKSIMKSATTTAANKGVAVDITLVIEKWNKTTHGNTILYGAAFDPATWTAKTNLKFSLKIDDVAVRTAFAKTYSNTMSVIKFDQTGSFGMPVDFKVKLDLSKLNKQTLRFYSYDKIKKTATLIETPNYWIDKSGYLHFTTTSAGYVIITDKTLVKITE